MWGAFNLAYIPGNFSSAPQKIPQEELFFFFDIAVRTNDKARKIRAWWTIRTFHNPPHLPSVGCMRWNSSKFSPGIGLVRAYIQWPCPVSKRRYCSGFLAYPSRPAVIGKNVPVRDIWDWSGTVGGGGGGEIIVQDSGRLLCGPAPGEITRIPLGRIYTLPSIGQTIIPTHTARKAPYASRMKDWLGIAPTPSGM